MKVSYILRYRYMSLKIHLLERKNTITFWPTRYIYSEFRMAFQ